MATDLYQQQLDYILQAAKLRGIDPATALTVAKSEGLQPGTWQSNVPQPYGREQSYGAFQLHVAPEGRAPGLGNDFKAATKLDPSDPANYKQMIDFSLDEVAKNGWSKWMGAKKAGITGMMGVGTNAQVMPANSTPTNPRMGGAIAPAASIAAGTTPVDPATNARYLASQQYTREGGTGGLRPQPSGTGPQNLQQALQMSSMNKDIVTPLTNKLKELYAGAMGQQPGATPVNPRMGGAGTPTVVPTSHTNDSQLNISQNLSKLFK